MWLSSLYSFRSLSNPTIYTNAIISPSIISFIQYTSGIMNKFSVDTSSLSSPKCLECIIAKYVVIQLSESLFLYNHICNMITNLLNCWANYELFFLLIFISKFSIIWLYEFIHIERIYRLLKWIWVQMLDFIGLFFYRVEVWQN